MENQPTPTNTTNANGAAPDNKDVDSGKGMAVLSYLGILTLIPYFAEKNNKYVRFHAVQGMNLLLIWVAYVIIDIVVTAIVTAAATSSCLGSTYSYYYGVASGSCAAGFGAAGIVTIIFGILGALIGVLAIIGIVYAATGKTKALPIVGKIKIIKK